jgi:asparagine synthase (glutamine-hydrolysing)
MCGIVGILDLNRERPISPAMVEKMSEAIVHRGPNDFGLHVDGPLGMGMRRLSIIDVASGHQPISNEDGSLWIVFNGEIYNHDSLRKELIKAGHKFKTQSDTEVILHLFEEKGPQALDHLQGMFAFAIWDSKNQSLFLARDRLGIKPLFWAQVDGYLVFASEMKALLTLPFVSRDIDWNGFDAFFTYTFIPAPLTIYKSIAKLRPGHCLTAKNGMVTDTQYWDLSFSDKFTGSEAKVLEGFQEVMSESVEMRLMSEVPLGSFLSGGIDSGIIVAMMSPALSTPVNTFTIGFGGETGSFLDEKPYAREIASRYKCRHREIEVMPRIADALDATITAFDEPFADDSVIPTFHICEEAAKEVIVVLTGLGGDENFAGYERYLGFWYSRFYERVPRFLQDKVLYPLVMNLKEEKGGHYRINHLKRFVRAGKLPPSQRYQSYQQVYTQQQRRALYAPEISAKIDFDYVDFLGREHFENLGEGDFLDRALYQDLKTYLPEDILALSDRMGMHHSLELRVPFVDHKVVEYCARIPSKWKIKGTNKKHMLKNSARSLLPDSVIDHRKQGFCAPMASWLRGDLRPVVQEHLNHQTISDGGFFQPSLVKGLVDDHMSLQQLNDKSLFSLLVFQKWLASGTR